MDALLGSFPDQNGNSQNRALLDQIVSAHAATFVGSKGSTFTNFIRQLRVLKGNASDGDTLTCCDRVRLTSAWREALRQGLPSAKWGPEDDGAQLGERCRKSSPLCNLPTPVSAALLSVERVLPNYISGCATTARL